MSGNCISTYSNDFDLSHAANSVSVIVPVYNGAKFIAATLNAILAQTVRAAEIIVVNDGSTDQTVPLVEEFGTSVTLIHTGNKGANTARNMGASSAKGNWLAFCDCDDFWLPTKLEKQLRLASEAPDIHCVLTDFSDIVNGVVANRSHFSWAPSGFWEPHHHQSGFVVREPITAKLTTFQPGITSTSMVKKDFFHKAGGFVLELPQLTEDRIFNSHDTVFHFRCLSAVPFGVVPEVLMHYNRHPESISADPVKQLRKTVMVWNHILAECEEAQPFRAELFNGLKAMRREIKETERYQSRQKLKRMLGLAWL